MGSRFVTAALPMVMILQCLFFAAGFAANCAMGAVCIDDPGVLMALYRALRNLSNGIDAGMVFDGARLQEKSIPVLVDKGAIAQVSAPPLAELPGWKIRGAKCKKIGIETVDEFMEVDIEKAAELLKVKPQLISAWKYEIINWLSAPKPKGG